MAEDGGWTLADGVVLRQRDVRVLQLAKAAFAAGMGILLRRLGASASGVKKLHLAGAFGNYVNRSSAERIGLLGIPARLVRPAGNTALLGAKLALFDDSELEEIISRVEHVPLAADPEFQEAFVDSMALTG
jgi:uncharacterized 2Fe-2S/4Fe-4S cluster protein (DUF4445 family)